MLTNASRTQLNVKTVVAAFNQEKALVGAFSVITNIRMELFEALVTVLAVALWAVREICQEYFIHRQ